jgi:methionine synthase II (cobalamin-independent)
VGAVTPYNGTESSEDVDRIVEKALSYVPAEKLVLTSDEGLAGNGFMTRRGAMHKMQMLSEAAARARTKLNA